MNLSFEIVEHGSTEFVQEISESFCSEVVSALFAHFPNFSIVDEISFCIVHSNNIEIQKLNLEFRSKDKSTNVLSFPLNQFSWKDIKSYKHTSNQIELGDIVFSIEKIREEAHGQEKNFKDYYAHLLIHSMLHLLGYDHETEEDAEVMEEFEEKILAALNIINNKIEGSCQ